MKLQLNYSLDIRVLSFMYCTYKVNINIFVIVLMLFSLSSCVYSRQDSLKYANGIYSLITYKEYLEPKEVIKYLNFNESDYKLFINEFEGKIIYKSNGSSNIESLEITTKINNKDIYQEIKVNFSNDVCISPEELGSRFWTDIRVATYDPVHVLDLAPANDDVKMVGRGTRFTISFEKNFKGMVSLFENGYQRHVLLNRNIYKN